MMRSDPIVEEMRAHGREFAAKHGNDHPSYLRGIEGVADGVWSQGRAPRTEASGAEGLQANQSLQPTATPLRGLSAAELGR